MNTSDVLIGVGIALVVYVVQQYLQDHFESRREKPKIKTLQAPTLVLDALEWRGRIANTGQLITYAFKKSATLITSHGSFEGEFRPQDNVDGEAISPNSLLAIYTKYKISYSDLKKIDLDAEASINIVIEYSVGTEYKEFDEIYILNQDQFREYITFLLTHM